MRWLSRREIIICALSGALIGMLARPQQATSPASSLTIWEMGMAVTLAVIGSASVTGAYWLVVRRMGW